MIDKKIISAWLEEPHDISEYKFVKHQNLILKELENAISYSLKKTSCVVRTPKLIVLINRIDKDTHVFVDCLVLEDYKRFCFETFFSKVKGKMKNIISNAILGDFPEIYMGR